MKARRLVMTRSAIAAECGIPHLLVRSGPMPSVFETRSVNDREQSEQRPETGMKARQSSGRFNAFNLVIRWASAEGISN